MLKKKTIGMLGICLLLFSGCGVQEDLEQSEEKTNVASSEIEDSSDSKDSSEINEEEIFSNRDFRTEYEENCAYIQLNGSSAVCESNAVEIEEGTITIKDEGTYVITGTLEDGQIVVESEETDKTQLVLKEASIHSETSAAIYIKQSDKVFITLEAGTENSLSNGGTFENIDENEIDGVIFSKSDLTLNGAGSLNIESAGGHGIVSKDDLKITDGDYSINAATHGLSANDMLGIGGGVFSIVSGEDSIHCDTNIWIENGTFEISAGDDAVHADETLVVCGGNIHISDSYEGLEALDIQITGGDISITASDDGLNAAGGTDQSGFGGMGNDAFGRPGGHPNKGQGGGPGGMQSGSSDGSIVITGGTLYIKASGDGIDANGTLEITGGVITVCGPTQGDTATLDYDVSGIITGGTFIGTGARNMAQTFSDAEQGVIAVSVGNQQAGTEITLEDSSGNTIISHAPELSFGVVILSSPDMVKGETYTITVGEASGEFEAE